jgi:hypothetical protein
MPIPTDELTRLSTGAPTGYNNDPFNASTNPYGFADGGYITNFFAALNDLTVVSLWVTDEIAPIVDIADEIEALGAIVAELQALAAIADDVVALGALTTQITALAAIAADITTVATNAAAVTAVATDIAKVAAVEAKLADIEAVADGLANITAVLAMAADIATVVARATDIATLADIEDGTTATGAIQAVAAIASAVSNVSSNSADVVAVAGDLSDINTLAGISSSVAALGPISADIAAVADISEDVEAAADNIAAIIAAPGAAEAARKSVRHILIDLTSTADSHPGAGKLRFSIDINAASPGATGTVFHDIVDADGGTSTNWIESFDDVINATGRGNISLFNETDASISLVLRVTGSVSSGTGYRKFPFTLLEKSGTIVDEDEFTETFQASGNDGGGGAGTGDVVSTGAISSGNIVQYADGTGDVIEDSGKAIADLFDITADDLDDIDPGTTNVHFTATEQTKLSGIEAAADVTDAGNVGSSIAGASNKATPVSADRIAILDSASGNALAYSTHAQVLAGFQTSFDSRYSQLAHTHAWADVTGRPDALVSVGGLTPAANKIPYYTGASTAALADFPASARTAFTAGFAADVLALLDDANFAAMRTTLGLAIGSNVQAYDSDLAAIAALSTTSLGRAILTLTGSAKRRIQVDAAGTGIEAVADWEPIEIGTALSSVASWSRTGLSAYESLRLQGFVLPGTSTAALQLHSSTNNGSSYDTGASDYYRVYLLGSASAATSGEGARPAIDLGVPHANSSYGGVSFDVTIRNFNKARRAVFQGYYGYNEVSGSPSIVSFFTQRGSDTVRDAIRLSMTTGNIASGSIVSLWGLRG